MSEHAIWSWTPPGDGSTQNVPAVVLWYTSNLTRIRVLRQNLEMEERSVRPDQVRLASPQCVRQNSRLYAVLQRYDEEQRLM
jgi:hypothetical protein